MNLLLVEDDADIRLVARMTLKRAGFTVTTVDNGLAALEAVRTNPPDVILLDWMLPEMDGPEVCRRLKADPALRDVPVIFLTARSQSAEIGRGLALGAAGYIVKPFDALTLGDEVRKLLGTGPPPG
jgi:two-component system phosphate regulon response regulator PhoB